MDGRDFSVLTVTKRTGWEKLAVDSMNRQTKRHELWRIIYEQELDWKAFIDCEMFVEFMPAPKPIRPSNLNASLNLGLRYLTAPYAIFYQDFIDLQEDCFEKLLALADEETFVTTCTPNYDGSNDSRFTGTGKPRACLPAEWEANVSIAPMQALREVGGFEEELDEGWSWDNVLVAEKAAMLGYKFVCDESNRPKLLPHEMSSHKTLEPNAERCYRILEEIRRGERPIKAKYL